MDTAKEVEDTKNSRENGEGIRKLKIKRRGEWWRDKEVEDKKVRKMVNGKC